jgi:putative FmdB family regulatory protein
MPIYEYACTSCGERTEAKQSFDDPPLVDCPHCGGKLRKLFSPVGVVFKGSGFYSTDAKSKSKSKGSSEKPAETKKSDTKAEPKPEKKDSSPKEKSA